MTKTPPNPYTTVSFWEKKVEAILDLIDENDRMIEYWNRPAQGKTEYAYAKQQVMRAMKFKLQDELNMARIIVAEMKAKSQTTLKKPKPKRTNYFGLAEGPMDHPEPVAPSQRQE